jgi:hypothetical protein
MLRYKLRTLLILLAVGPPSAAGVYSVRSYLLSIGAQRAMLPLLVTLSVARLLILTVRMRPETSVGIVFQRVTTLALMLLTLLSALETLIRVPTL